MAQLKDTVVSGSLRATDTLYSTINQFQILKIPTSSNGTTYGVGNNGQILKSNGTSVYWANDNDTTNLTSMTGTLGVEHGGTGSATADGARTNLGLGSLAIKSALIESDIPTLSIIEKTTGTLPISRGGTGEETDLDAITNLGSIYIKYGGTLISRNSNIDSDCLNPGTYYSPNQSTSESFAGNPPTTSSGFKLITTGGYSNSVFHQFATVNSEVLLYRFGKITDDVLQWVDWRRFVLLPKTNETFANIGSATQPVYINKSGVVVAGNSLGNLAYKNDLVSSDIPNLSANKITSDTFDTARIPTLSIIDKTSGTLTVARGGTGATSFTANSVVISGNTTTAALTTTGTGTAGQYLISNGENNPPSWKELEIGGRNLALETTTPAISSGSSGGSALAPLYELSDYGKQIIIDQNTSYIVSFDWELSEPAVNDSDTPYIYVQLNGSQINPEYTQPVGDAINGHYTTTLIPTNSQRNYTDNPYFYVRIRLRYAQDGVILTVRNLKFEKGTKATDWSPAPEDLTNFAQSYTDSVVNDIKIGGRNLLLDSGRERSVTVATGKTDASFNEISLSEYGATQITEGAELTASFDYEVDLTKTTNGAFYTRLNTTSTVPARVVSDIIAVPRGRASITFNVTAAQAQYSSDFVFRVRIALSNEGASLKIWNVKLELGNHATDWTPAPEDFIETTNGIYYGVCGTAQATQAKEATLVNGSNFSLKEGTMVAIKFTYASTSSTMTLNVNGTGAKNLYLYGTSLMSSSTTVNGWPAGAVVIFIYDGTSWIRQYWNNTTYTLTSVWSNTAADTAAKASSNSSYFTIKDGTYFDFTLRYSNTAQSALTLNINGTGAKDIYINGEPSSNTNYELPGGKYLVYYDDDKYYFINPGQQNAPDPIIGPVTGNGAITGPQALNKLGIIYSSTAPLNPIEGMIWLQPI